MRTALALILLASCTEPDAAEPEVSDVSQDVTNTPCATVPADYILYVPNSFFGQTIASPNGSYGYIRNGAASTCAGYIVDVYMATYSALNPYQGYNTNDGTLVAYGGPYDLPGSAVANGTIPTNKEDCQRLSSILYAYTWPHTDVGYTYVGGLLRTGQWSSGTCSLVTTSTYGTIPKPRDSTSGWDKYRYVINAFERTTYQEAAVYLNLPPPS